MFSVFADVFGGKPSAAVSLDLAKLLRDAGITHVFIAGLTGDFCVKFTALDARKEGFDTIVVEEGVRSVDSSMKGWGAAKDEMQQAGIRTISMNSPEVAKIKSLT